MYCTKCGRDIGTNNSCPYCGEAPKIGDTFVASESFVLDAPGVGGFTPVSKSYGTSSVQENTTMDALAFGGFKPLVNNDSSSTSKGLDPLGEIGFKPLGPVNGHAMQEMDSPCKGGFKPLQPVGSPPVSGETQRIDPLGSGGFKPLIPAGNSVSGETQEMDLPGGGGFKPIVEVIPANEGSSETRKKDLPKAPESPAPHIQWKRWMFLIPLCCTMLLLVIFNISNKPELSKKDVLSAAIDDYIQNEIYTGESLPLMQQYQNAILEAITYDIQSYDWIGGTMDVEFAYIDVLHLADSITDPNISEDEYYSTCIKMIRSKECKMITEVIRVSFEFSGEEYSVISSDPLSNVLSGGVLNYYLALLEGTDYE